MHVTPVPKFGPLKHSLSISTGELDTASHKNCHVKKRTKENVEVLRRKNPNNGFVLMSS